MLLRVHNCVSMLMVVRSMVDIDYLLASSDLCTSTRGPCTPPDLQL